MFMTVMLLLMISSALICHIIANKRHANTVFWGVMGFAFGPFAIPFVFMSKPFRGHNDHSPVSKK